MNVNIINSFISAIAEVMPQLGFQDVKRGNLKLSNQPVTSRGIVVIVGLTKQLKGNVAYNMGINTAKKFASTMMMGMAVDSFDEMAQSAISELVNMVTASAAIHLEKSGLIADISPPMVVFGKDSTTNFCTAQYIILEMFVDGELVEVNVGADVL